MKHYLACSLLMMFVCVSAAHTHEATPLFVGFWEDGGIRKTFEYKEKRWHSSLLELSNSEELKKAATRYILPSQWTIFFNGKIYGNISTKPFQTYKSYKENGLQNVVSEKPNLNFRKIEKTISGWHDKKTRPVLVSNVTDLADPNQRKINC